MNAEPTKQLPKGRARGGARFPRYSLEDALPWAKKLVSKTHSGAVPADIVLASVVSKKGTRGEVKLSALRQYDLIQGSNDSLSATELAKSIAFADTNEIKSFYSKAALSPAIFKGLFDTFHGDEISVVKLKQRAVELNVHPDSAEQCVSLYIDSLLIAGLLESSGDKIKHSPASEISVSPSKNASLEDTKRAGDQDDEDKDKDKDILEEASSLEPTEDVDDLTGNAKPPRAVFNVNVSLDSSLDTEKLEKQLALLKKFGAI